MHVRVDAGHMSTVRGCSAVSWVMNQMTASHDVSSDAMPLHGQAELLGFDAPMKFSPSQQLGGLALLRPDSATDAVVRTSYTAVQQSVLQHIHARNSRYHNAFN